MFRFVWNDQTTPLLENFDYNSWILVKLCEKVTIDQIDGSAYGTTYWKVVICDFTVSFLYFFCISSWFSDHKLFHSSKLSSIDQTVMVWFQNGLKHSHNRQIVSFESQKFEIVFLLIVRTTPISNQLFLGKDLSTYPWLCYVHKRVTLQFTPSDHLKWQPNVIELHVDNNMLLITWIYESFEKVHLILMQSNCWINEI